MNLAGDSDGSASQAVLPHGAVVRSDLPARLDALPWSPWHWRIVIALGVSWMLDGLEVTLVGSLGAVLQREDTLGLSATEIGLAGSSYIAGAVLGALMAIAAGVAAVYAVPAERKPLEDVAAPLGAWEDERSGRDAEPPPAR
jgi:hypothetical protein